MKSDPRDVALQAHVPSVMVPKFNELEALAADGHRYLIAADGLWLEVRRRWMHMRGLVAPLATDGVKLPYGHVAEGLRRDHRELEIVYAWQAEDLERLQTLFLHDATKALPDEFAAWGIWNAQTARLEYRGLITTNASPGSITFARPKLESHEHLAIDLHSHGATAAFFSRTDDEDDAGEVKLSVVAGNLDDTPTFATRLCVLGLFIEGTSDRVYP